jgi:hypothetical protein
LLSLAILVNVSLLILAKQSSQRVVNSALKYSVLILSERKSDAVSLKAQAGKLGLATTQIGTMKRSKPVPDGYAVAMDLPRSPSNRQICRFTLQYGYQSTVQRLPNDRERIKLVKIFTGKDDARIAANSIFKKIKLKFEAMKNYKQVPCLYFGFKATGLDEERAREIKSQFSRQADVVELVPESR